MNTALAETPCMRATDIVWRDLLTLSLGEKFWETTLSLPWLLGALWAYHEGHIVIGLACSFYLFLTGLRQSHGAQHYSLGWPRVVQDVVLYTLSVVMLASMHAVQVSHMHHHRHCLKENDTEGATARLPWWQAIMMGPVFLFTMHRTAWRLGTAVKRRWIVAELCGIASVILLALWTPELHALRWHVGVMLAGECLTGFFAVWIVHHGCEAEGTIARTQRGPWINWLSYSMFFHAEHHLFPQVPTCHLKRIAERLDHARHAVAAKQVIPLRDLWKAPPAGKHRTRHPRCSAHSGFFGIL
ncbi:MAG: fatty acid desaturase [Verrucomicrobiaceae bacterium]|nr:fatty acid desaturase [Verrucomicrobiaceae bacterium]